MSAQIINTVFSFPNAIGEIHGGGIEWLGDECYVNCAVCGKRKYWMKKTLSIEVFTLPAGWSTVRGYGICCDDDVCIKKTTF